MKEEKKLYRVELNGISKRFKIGFNKRQTALARFISLFSGRTPKKSFQVLNDISFKAESGQIIGIIGKNGSGKSTLLRVIAGIYNFDKGSLKTNGKIISLINLYSGLQTRLTMRDNIYLCCSLFGLGQKSIKKRFNSIVGFADLEDFISTKLYQFSTGMLQRLAFSIAIHSNPEILLLDEVFEIGDEGFKDKSADKIKELVNKGATVLLVSHNFEIIQKYCDKVILIKKGKILKEGKATDLINKYKKNL